MARPDPNRADPRGSTGGLSQPGECKLCKPRKTSPEFEPPSSAETQNNFSGCPRDVVRSSACRPRTGRFLEGARRALLNNSPLHDTCTLLPCRPAKEGQRARERLHGPTPARAQLFYAGSSSALLCQPPFTCLALRECLEHAFTPRTILTHALRPSRAFEQQPSARHMHPAALPTRKGQRARERLHGPTPAQAQLRRLGLSSFMPAALHVSGAPGVP